MDPETTSRRAELEARLRFETLIADLSSKFVNLPAGNVDDEIMNAERLICEALSLDFSALWQWSDEPPGFFALTHYYSVLEGPQPSKRLNVGDYPWFVQQMLAGRIVAISSLEEMPEEAAHDREICRQHGVKSNLCLPLSVGGKPVGILGLNTTQEERDWPDAVVKRLQLLAEILANALARKRADKALQESEERLSLAADSAEAGLWVLDCRTWIFWSTEKARVIFGYLPQEVLSFECFKSSVHPDDRTRVEEAVDRSLRLGEAVDIEYRIRLGDGRERWIASRGRPFFRANGEPERLMGVSMDITVRKKTEEQVRQLSLAVEQSPVSVVITDLQGKMIYVNHKFSEVSGYSFGECTGQNPRILKSGECAPATYQELWKCITKGGTWRGEFHNRKKSGELYWEWAVISPLLDEAGKVTHFVGVKEDITERKEADKAFHASESRLAAGTDLAGLGYYEVDYGARTCFLDDRFREICGVPPEVQQGLEPVAFWLAHIHPDDRQRVSDERQALHEGMLHKTSTEYRYLHPIQGQRWIHHLARVTTRNITGHTTRTFGVLRDITEQHRTEEAIHDLSARLIGAQEEERARLARELHDGLSQNLALQAVQLELMAERPPATAAESASRLQELSAQMKRLSTEVHRISHDLHPAKLTQLGLAAAIAELCQAGLSVHQIPISFHHSGIPRSLPLGVALCLYRVAQESIQNVVKHSGAKAVSVELTLVKNEVQLCVADNGRGFDLESKRDTHSLGLVSMRERVRAVRGQIRIESKPGAGTRVTVSLPVPEETKR